MSNAWKQDEFLSCFPFYHFITPAPTKWERNRLCLKINFQLNYPLRIGQDIYFLKICLYLIHRWWNLTVTQNGKIWFSERVPSRHKISLRLKLQTHSAFLRNSENKYCRQYHISDELRSTESLSWLKQWNHHCFCILKITGWKIKNLKHTTWYLEKFQRATCVHSK